MNEIDRRVTHTCGCVTHWHAVEPINEYELIRLAGYLEKWPCPWHGGESGEPAPIAVKGLAWDTVPFCKLLSVSLIQYNGLEGI